MSGVNGQMFSMLRPSLHHDFPTRIRRMAIGAVAFLVVGLLAARIIATIAPPPLTIHEPTDRLVTGSRVLSIRGTTAPEAELHINGRSLAPDTAGRFATDVILLPGLNTIEVSARRRHSQPIVIRREVQVVEMKAPLTSAMPDSPRAS